MDFISSIISEELVYALGWTVVHSLWQAVGVAFIMAGFMLALQKHSSKVRYRLAYAALLVVLIMSALTFFDLYQFARQKDVIEITQLTVQSSGEYAPALAEIPATPTLLQRFTSYFNTHLPLIVSVWLLGLSLFVIRLVGGLAYLEHLKTTYTYQIETHWEDMLQYLAEQLPIKRTVELMESALVQVPIVVGHFKPIILMPIGAVNGLTIEQVEAILAHELAHIARNDYILNIIQSVVEALLYFNPAVWWISANIRTERENCCDDVAIQLCGNKLTYAKALVAIQEMNHSAPSLAMAFGKRKGQFLNRIRRILNQPQNKSDMIEKITATFLLLAVVLGLTVSAAQPDYDKFSTAETPDLVIVTDTLPQKGTMNFTGRHNGQDVKTTVKDGKITYLKIEGKEIPESEYKEYEPLVEEIMENVPPPPPPPPAPIPPVPGVPSAPPAPPAPPAPSSKYNDGDYSFHFKDGTDYSFHFKEISEEELNLIEDKLRLAEEAVRKSSTENREALQKVVLELQAKQEVLEKEFNENWRKGAELQAKQMQQAQALNEEQLHKMEQEHRAAMKVHEVNMKHQEQALKKMEEELRKAELVQKEVQERVVKELLADKLITDKENFKFKLNHTEMWANGKKVSAEMSTKYKKLFEEITGNRLEGNATYSINMSNTNNREY